MRSMKKQQRLSSEKTSPNYYSPLTKLKDAQVCYGCIYAAFFIGLHLLCYLVFDLLFLKGFAEKLFSRLQSCNERFEVCIDQVFELMSDFLIITY